MSDVLARFPEKLQFLFSPARYKVAYGGRGGAKSWGFARALLIIALQKPMLIVCAREIQTSIRDSVHRLLANQVDAMGLGDFYSITNERITGANGSEFIFKGLWQNVDNIKSLEGADIVWIEEGNLTSKHTWDKLVPTVRKAGSEIWVSYNPELEEDETHQRFVMQEPPTGAVVVKINYPDNPWFPDVLRQEMEDCRRKDPAAYRHIWLGECKQAIDGAIFANELQKAAEEHRITRVQAVSGVPVHTFWDLGQSDNTAIWFVQVVGLEYRIIDYYQNNGQKMPHYIDVLARRGYMYGEHCLPHDADYDQIAASETIKQQLQNAVRDNSKLGSGVKVVPRITQKALGIDAARNIFERCVFDRQKTADGLQCLRRYHYARDVDTGRISKHPAHDIYSHGADAFLCLAQHARPERKPVKIEIKNLKRFR